MTLHLPEFIDENVDYTSDPLMILLMREGAHEEAYQTARQQTAGARQIVLQREIEACEERAVSRTRKIRH